MNLDPDEMKRLLADFPRREQRLPDPPWMVAWQWVIWIVIAIAVAGMLDW